MNKKETKEMCELARECQRLRDVIRAQAEQIDALMAERERLKDEVRTLGNSVLASIIFAE